MAIKIFVEGIADIKFLKDYISYLYNIKLTDEDLIDSKGWTKIESQNSEGEAIRNTMQHNSDNDGTNLLIFDADENYQERYDKISEWKEKLNLEFDIFLWPNDSETGDLEVTLENIINKNNAPIFDCWSNYEDCLTSKTITGREKPLTVPARKTKIYGYLEALLGESKSQKKLIKELNRDYKKTEFWNLDSEYLNPLKEFLDKYFI